MISSTARRDRLTQDIHNSKVSDNKAPVILWSKERGGFALALPKGPMPSPIEMESLFKGEVLNCFKDSIPILSIAQRSVPSDDWANVSVDTATGKPAVIDHALWKLSSTVVSREVDVLPNYDVLPRPDELLLKPPYHLTITNTGNQLIDIQCSHSPTLQLLADYLKKWCKTNPEDSRKVNFSFIPCQLPHPRRPIEFWQRICNSNNFFALVSVHVSRSNSTSHLSVSASCMIG